MKRFSAAGFLVVAMMAATVWSSLSARPRASDGMGHLYGILYQDCDYEPEIDVHGPEQATLVFERGGAVVKVLTSDTDGRYRVDLPAGDYRTYESYGHTTDCEPGTMTDVRIVGGCHTRMDIHRWVVYGG